MNRRNRIDLPGVLTADGDNPPGDAEMTMDYAKAYGTERMAQAATTQRQRKAMLAARARRVGSAGFPIRPTVGSQLMRIETRPSKARSAMSRAIEDLA